MSLLEVSDIDVSYGQIQALRGVSLKINAGEIVALLGPNGAGKSTTLRAMSGVLAPTQGSITFDGKQLQGLPANRVVGMGVAHVPEGRELFSGLSVLENLRLGHWTRRHTAHDFDERLERVMGYFPKLRERSRQAAGTMSGGEQQMLVIARSLMSAPKLLLVDEPSLGLAPQIVRQLFDIFEEINRDGTSVLIVEQFVDLALRHSHRAYVLARGEMQLEAKSEDLVHDEALLAAYLGGEVQPSWASN